MPISTTTVKPPGTSTSESHAEGGQEAPVYKPVDTSRYGNLFTPIVDKPIAPPAEYEPAAFADWQTRSTLASRQVDAQRKLQADLKQVAETGKLVVGGQSHQLSPEQVEKLLTGVQAGIQPTIETLATAVLAPDLMAQAHQRGLKESKQAARTTDQPDPSKKPKVDPVVTGGEEVHEESTEGIADRYMNSLPSKDVDPHTLFLASMKQSMGEEKYNLFRKGELVVENILDDE